MDTEVISAVRKHLQTKMAKEWIPAIAYAVIRDAELIEADALGIANLEWGASATVNTAFQLASATKPLTGTLLMMCVERGEIRLDATISEYLPDTPKPWNGITVRQLATHTSGLSDEVTQTAQRQAGSDAGARERSVADMVAAAAQLPLAFEPGSTSAYGLTDFVVLTAILETATGREFQRLLRERLLDPLGMTSTRFDNAVDGGGMRTMDIVPRRASVYRLVDGIARDFKFFYPTWSYAAGGIYSSVANLAKWLIALERGELLRPETMREMWTPQQLTNDEDGLFSPGWVVYTHRGRPVVGHSGGPALGDILWFPNDGLKVVVLCNLQGPLPDLAPGVADLIHMRNSFAAARAAMANGSPSTGAPDPSHPLVEYAGQYEHPEFGIVTIRRNEARLTLGYKEQTVRLPHVHGDVFTWNREGQDRPIPAIFTMGLDGSVDGIVIALDTDAPPSAFTRSVDSSLRDRGFLQRFAGEYVLMGAPLTVTLTVEGQLQATVPGQPPLVLEPFRGAVFTVNGAVGTTVEFQLDESGAVTSVILRQPMGEIVAQRTQEHA